MNSCTMTTALALVGLLLGGEALWQGEAFSLVERSSPVSCWIHNNGNHNNGNHNNKLTAATKTIATTTTIRASNPTHQDWDAAQYHTQCSFVYEFGQSLIDLVDVRPGESVLDVGCGTGVLTAALSANGQVDVIGMDADPNMIDVAHTKFPTITFRQGDARNFTLTEPVDVIFSNAALHWIPCHEMDQAMVCLARALKPNGRLVVELGGDGNVRHIITALQYVLQERHNVTFDCPWCFPTIADFTRQMEHNGIETVSAVLYDRPTALIGGNNNNNNNNEHGLNDWLRMFVGQFLVVAPHLDDYDTLTAINDRLRPLLYNVTQQLWIADYRRLRVVGRKR